jgi:DNA-binding XRE family transcriptional regulator
MVILPRADFESLRMAAEGAIEDLDDAAEARLILSRIEAGSEGALPHDVVMRMRKENRVKVVREYRQMTQKELAKEAGINALYLSQIETGRVKGGRKSLGKIAVALDVTLDMIQPK